MTKHTPSPWEREPSDMGYPGTQIRAERGGLVARLYAADDFPCLDEGMHDQVNAEANANGNLIVAAPELLDAAKAAVLQLDLMANMLAEGGRNVAAIVLENVIKKAEGGFS